MFLLAVSMIWKGDQVMMGVKDKTRLVGEETNVVGGRHVEAEVSIL